MSNAFVPVVSEVHLSPNVHFDAQVNRVGECMLAVLEEFSLSPYGACEGCMRNACDNCGAGGLYAKVIFAPLEGDRFIARLWAPQLTPLTRYSRSQLIRTWRTTPSELDTRLRVYIGLPFLLAGLTLRVQGSTTHAVARLSCIPWDVVRAELNARQARKEAEKQTARELVKEQRVRKSLEVQRRRERQIAQEQARVRPRVRSIKSYSNFIQEEYYTNLDPQIRAFYREFWGFDPVNDRVKFPLSSEELGFGRRFRGTPFYYEAEIPLESDPELIAAGVRMYARVEVKKPREPHNRLIFLRDERSKGVECIHTIIHATPLADLAELTKADYSEMVQLTRGQPANISPWVHFAALKSFAGGLAAAGLLNVLLPDNLGSQVQEPAPLEMNSALMKQLRDALHTVASDIIHERKLIMQGSLVEQAPEHWLSQRWSLLQKAYGVNSVFMNPSLLASLEAETQLKLLRIFLSFLHSKMQRVTKAGARFLPVVLTSVNIETINDTYLLQETMRAICLSWGKRTWTHYEQVPRLVIKRILDLNEPTSIEIKKLLGIVKNGAPLDWKEHHLHSLAIEHPFLQELLATMNNIRLDSVSK